MKPCILALSEGCTAGRSTVGNKAAVLGAMMAEGLRVPQGICITRHAYDTFLHETGQERGTTLLTNRKSEQVNRIIK